MFESLTEFHYMFSQIILILWDILRIFYESNLIFEEYIGNTLNSFSNLLAFKILKTFLFPVKDTAREYRVNSTISNPETKSSKQLLIKLQNAMFFIKLA